MDKTSSGGIHEGAIDIVVNPMTPEAVSMRPDWSLDFLRNKVSADSDLLTGIPSEDFVAYMDDAAVGHALLVAAKAGSKSHAIHYQIEYEHVAALVEKFPDRFSGLAGLDPLQGMRELRSLENAVRDLGFVGAHVYPHWFDLPPDDRRFYPLYAKCCELDIPIQIQVGHCLVYSRDRPLRSVGRPLALDRIACDFPELKLIGIHIGWPWTEEMISVAYKHDNVYIGGDAYAPKHWPQAFVHFASTWGKRKVMFGTDFPVIDIKRATREVSELGIPDEAMKLLMRDNALCVYGLESSR